MLRKKHTAKPRAEQTAVVVSHPKYFREPERLVGLGFRAWLAGYETGDIRCWEQAWNMYSDALGPTQARAALTDLACWVRAIRNASCKPIEVFPGKCAQFCRDECMAIAMVAASQHGACPALRACAWALIESSAIDEVVEGAECLGATLKSCQKVLSPASICAFAALCPLRPHGRPN